MKPDKANRTKHVSISMTVAVDDEVSQEAIAERIEEALRPMAEMVRDVSDVAIRTVPRTISARVDGGYETRLWEKATCDIFGGLRDPSERIYPVDREVEEVASELERVAKRLSGR